MSDKCKIIEIFQYRRRTIVIILMDTGSSIGTWHNGYVSVRPSNKGVDYDKTYSKIQADEATYDGYLGKEWGSDIIPHDMYFLGFDSVHSWNDCDPESKSFDSVKERAKRFADDMIKARI